MKTKLLLSLAVISFHFTAGAQTTAFTYQGRLIANGAPANGTSDLTFTLFTAASGGAVVGVSNTLNDVAVSSGLFTVTLDFGAAAFDGNARWLEIAVRPGASTGAYTSLAPRQPLNATPYAVRAANFSGAVADNQLSANVARLNSAATFTGPVSFSNANNSFAGTFIGNGSGMTNVSLHSLDTDGAITRGHFVLASSPDAGAAQYWVATADVNGDGKPDLISATPHTDTLAVLTNNGSGGFARSSSPVVGIGHVAVVAADVNGDGKPDLISGTYVTGTNNVTVVTNNGSGGFVFASFPPVGEKIWFLTAGDVNGDGRADLITANFQTNASGQLAQSNTLTVLTNNGRGNFLVASSPALAFTSLAVTAADINGDGKLDLVAPSYITNRLTVLTNNGNSGFVPALSLTVGLYPRSVAAADINGDGKIDLVSANVGTDGLSVLTNNGSGNFVTASSPSTGVGSTPIFVAAADVNEDGRQDLISVPLNSPRLSILINNGSAGFVTSFSQSLGSGGINPAVVVAADFNGDGRVDLATGNSGRTTLSILFNTLSFSGSFIGDGSGLTNISAASIGSGIALLAANQTFTGDNTIAPPATLSFGGGTRQMLNLWDTIYGIGVQNTRLYFRTAYGPNDGFAWFKSGSHSNTPDDPGPGGTNLMTLDLTGLKVGNVAAGDVTANSFSGNGAGLTNLSAANIVGGSVARLNADQTFTGNNTFTGNITSAPSATLSFGSETRQMLNLWGISYGIGVQNSTIYFRTDNAGPENGFAWYKGGTHTNAAQNPGMGGQKLMSLTANGLSASSGINVPTPATLSFGAQTRQMVNLYGTQYGIGVQAYTTYFRAADDGPNNGFAWYRGGVHNDNYANAGGGTEMMHLVPSGLYVNGALVVTSDRNAKENFEPINGREVLDKVVALPLSKWNYKTDTSIRHVGPMAQDFHAAFGLGIDDKHIATVDADGVALAAIQGLNEIVKEKDARIAELERRLEKLEQRMNPSNGGGK